MRRHLLLSALLLTASAACGSDAPTGALDAATPGQDGADPSDALPSEGGTDPADGDAPGPDQGLADAGTSTITDGGAIEDAGTSSTADAGPAPDAGTDLDAGPAPDLGTPDSGLPDDLGDACNEAGDCSTGYCFQRVGTDVCSLCTVNGDCGVQQACRYSNDLDYAVCVGTGVLGASCTGNEQCASTHCNSGICSECQADGDCTAGGTCEDDRSGVGYFVCTGGLGDACTDGTECGTGYCFNPQGPGPNRCSECELNGDCGAQRACQYSVGDQYASCVGTGALGNICNTGDQCASGYCQSGVCSQCESTPDCTGGGDCVDDTAGVGYYVCQGGLGDVCAEAADCNSGYCYPVPAAPDRCSICETSQDCPNNGICAPNLQLGYAVCY